MNKERREKEIEKTYRFNGSCLEDCTEGGGGGGGEGEGEEKEGKARKRIEKVAKRGLIRRATRTKLTHT